MNVTSFVGGLKPFKEGMHLQPVHVNWASKAKIIPVQISTVL